MNEKNETGDKIPVFDDKGIVFDFDNKKYCPEMLARIGVSVGEFFGYSSTVAVGRDLDSVAEMSAMALSSGLMFSGANVKTLQETTLPMMRWICRQGIVDGGVYISCQEEKRICILDNHGNDITTAKQKRFIKICSVNGKKDIPKDYIGDAEMMSAPEEFYTSFIFGMFPEAYRCLNFGVKNFTEDIKDIVCAVMSSKLYPGIPIFASNKIYPAVLKILGDNVNIVRSGNSRGDIMAEMERFIDISGVYQQYLMMFDDFAFDVAVSHFKAVFGLDELRKTMIPRIYRRSAFIECDKYAEDDFFEYLVNNDLVGEKFAGGEVLLKNKNGLAFIFKNPLRNGIEISVEGYKEEYAEEITGEIERIFNEYRTKK